MSTTPCWLEAVKYLKYPDNYWLQRTQIRSHQKNLSGGRQGLKVVQTKEMPCVNSFFSHQPALLLLCHARLFTSASYVICTPVQ